MEGREQSEKRLELLSRPSLIRLMVIGVVAGAVSALAGIGGGVITIPMKYYLLHMPLKLAIGTSSAAIFITAFFSVTGYIVHGMGHAELPKWGFGFIDLQRGIAIAMGTVILARVGAYVSFKTHPFHLRKLFALFVIFISIYMLVR